MRKLLFAAVLALSALSAMAQIKDVMTIRFKDGTTVKYNTDAVSTCDFLVEDVADPEAPAIGDYYYSDGTWSAVRDASKTVIGIVFWTGDPTDDDAKLKKEHPECTHGLVMALNQVESPWQEMSDSYGMSKWVSNWLTDNGYPSCISGSSVDDIINKKVGYSYTSYIEAFNAAEANAAWPVSAVEAIVNYRKQVPAPANSSDWYLGSPLELVYACFGEVNNNVYDLADREPKIRDLLNAKFSLIEGAETTLDPDGDGYSFWCPMEYDRLAWSAYNVYFNRNKVPVSVSSKTWSDYARVRAILAF